MELCHTFQRMRVCMRALCRQYTCKLIDVRIEKQAFAVPGCQSDLENGCMLSLISSACFLKWMQSGVWHKAPSLNFEEGHLTMSTGVSWHAQ